MGLTDLSSTARVGVDGKFFRLGRQKFHVKGVAYGPFAPSADPDRSGFASPEQTACDFIQIRELGANLVRIYEVPARWFLDLAARHQLKVLVDIPWDQRRCILDLPEQKAAARDAVRRTVGQCGGHPAIFAYSVANEIPPDIVRWSGAKAVADYIDELICQAKEIDPNCLCTFTNYPPTEFLRLQSPDFLCFNVYLHHRRPFENYLRRLQMIADTKPLVLGELGMDSVREGERTKCEFFSWQIESAFRGGVAGAVVFSFTDDWFRGGKQVEDWAMGLTMRDRKPKESFRVVQKVFCTTPYFPLPSHPKVSVVVASYNADRTLQACLDSLTKLNYPDYEIILVDDGSTDTTPQIAARHPKVRCFRHATNLGLGVARNTGIAAATGEIVAFTDADCRVDEDWLYHLVGDLLDSEFAGVGGPNLLPPEDSPVAAAVMVSPGGPAHVMLTDRQAEHIPGCNMAFYQWALAEMGGFDPLFHAAGDDVDICWRLQQAGRKIGFSPAAFVWHCRRPTVGAYLKQQRGYGEAEALLVRKHPAYFNFFGGSVWRGRIYAASKFGVLLRRPIIHGGLFGSGWFQSLYAAEPSVTPMLCTALEYHVFVTLPLWVLAALFNSLLPLAATSLLISLGVCVTAGAQAALPPNKIQWWSRPLVALLYFLQPIVRGWARYEGRLRLRPTPGGPWESLDSIALRDSKMGLGEVQYLTKRPIERVEFVSTVLKHLDRQGWQNLSDIGWSGFDVEIYGNRWVNLQLTTVAEDHPHGRQLIRCRLRGCWSLHAKVAFWGLVGLDLLAIGFFSGWSKWIGLSLLTLPALAWFLARQKRTLQSVVVVFLDGLAKERNMTKVLPSE
jgi:glycosyltransferase involved in cell wall biosynthesis